MRLPVSEAMHDLLTVADNNLRRDTGIQFLAPGEQVAWDDCCDDGGVGGQLWVRCLNVFPTGPFPQQDNDQKCGVRFTTAVLAVGVVRCAHTLDDQGNSPTAEEMNGDTLGIMDDMEDLFTAITQDYHWKHTVGRWSPLGPDGGCAGGEWVIQVMVQPCA